MERLVVSATLSVLPSFHLGSIESTVRYCLPQAVSSALVRLQAAEGRTAQPFGSTFQTQVPPARLGNHGAGRVEGVQPGRWEEIAQTGHSGIRKWFGWPAADWG